MMLASHCSSLKKKKTNGFCLCCTICRDPSQGMIKFRDFSRKILLDLNVTHISSFFSLIINTIFLKVFWVGNNLLNKIRWMSLIENSHLGREAMRKSRVKNVFGRTHRFPSVVCIYLFYCGCIGMGAEKSFKMIFKLNFHG